MFICCRGTYSSHITTTMYNYVVINIRSTATNKHKLLLLLLRYIGIYITVMYVIRNIEKSNTN